MNPPTPPQEYWACATIKDGKVFGIVEGFPAGTLAENDIRSPKKNSICFVFYCHIIEICEI